MLLAKTPPRDVLLRMGARLRELAQDETFNEMLVDLEVAYIEAWKGSEDKKEREHMWMRQKVLSEMKRYMEVIIEAAEYEVEK